jgi:PAS domain S-box-containing protein
MSTPDKKRKIAQSTRHLRRDPSPGSASRKHDGAKSTVANLTQYPGTALSTILVVDDHTPSRELLVANLRRNARNCRLFGAASGEEALEITREKKPDLIIMDVLMPKMDGYEFVHRLRRDPMIADTAVIFYSANYIENEAQDLAEACGVDRLIIKPFKPEELLRTINATLAENASHARTAPLTRDFDREHLRLVTDKLAEKVKELQRLNTTFLEQADILNRARDAIIIRNFIDLRVTSWNAGAERMYGWRASEAIGRPIGELVTANSGEVETFNKIIASTGEFQGEVKQRTKDGREIIVEGRATLIRNEDGTPRSVLLINTDVTGQKKLEMQLNRAERLESIGRLAGGVAHDLNNILTPILMCAETLRRDLSEEDRKSVLALIEQSARRGAAIVKQVLTFARGVEGERVSIKPTHLIEEMADIARKTFPKSIEITGHYPEDVWSINGDPTQLHQVLLNLSVNARDAMPNGGAISIAADNFTVDEHYASMTPDAERGPHVILRVTDTGSGMPREIIDKIFDPFFTTKDVGRGTGLGLSTVLGIVKNHGGFISVYSEVGSGTTFKVFLPAEVSESVAIQSETSCDSLHGNNELILVVDDEPAIIEVIRRILENHDYRVLSANDGPEALATLAEQKNVAAVLTDVSMPYMDGVALVRVIRKMRPKIAFIASSGHGEEPRIPELESLRVTNFLTKPYDTKRLLYTVRDTLAGKPSAP